MSGTDQIELSTLISRLGEEIAGLHRLSLDHQAALSALAPNVPPPQPWISAGLQGIDRIAQSLADIARLMAALSHDLEPAQHLTAERLRKAILLRDLSDRIMPGSCPRQNGPTPEPGEISWF